MIRFSLWCRLTLLSAFVVTARAVPAPDLSIEDLFRAPQVRSLTLSPNGEYVAGVGSDSNDAHSLIVIDLKTHQTTGIRGHDKFDVYSANWVNNDTLLYSVSQWNIYAEGLYAIRRDRLDADPLVVDADDVTRLIGIPRNRKDRAIVWITQIAEKWGDPGTVVEFDLSARTESQPLLSKASIVHDYPPPAGTVVGWFADYWGDVKFCYTYADEHMHLHALQADGKTWRELPIDVENVDPMGADPNGKALWVADYDRSRGFGLRALNLDTGVLGAPVFTDTRYDFGDGELWFSRKTRQLVGICYTQRRLQHVWIAEPFKSAQAAADHSFPETDNELVDTDDNEQRFLFRRKSGERPNEYVVLDLAEKKWVPVASTTPWLKDHRMNRPTPISFRTRDGITLEGYLTLPNGASEAHPVPLVVLPHGGPAARDEWEFDPEVQFLASRGYAVLQPNYRGSTGYVPEITRTKKYDFRVMHDDVTDATKAMMHSELIDPKRVAIMGSGFGGYLAVAGVAFEPNLYRCAVSTCGVFDWETFIKSKRYKGRPGEYEVLRDHLGMPGENHNRFESFSPLSKVDSIRVPVFVAHGEDDSIVDIKQSRALAAALKSRGIPCETYFRPFNTHGFSDANDRIEYYKEVEAFLAKNLRDAPATVASAAR